MPGFNQILAEIRTAQGNPALGNPFDHVRRKYIGLLAAKTGRHTIVYASRFLQGGPPGFEQLVLITDEDIQGLMSTVQGGTSDKLDLLTARAARQKRRKASSATCAQSSLTYG
jgi:hypothetical protein